MSETRSRYYTRRELEPINTRDKKMFDIDDDVSMMQGESGVSKRMRDPVQKVYNRQVAKCLSDIEKVFTLPEIVEDRIKRAIEYTCKDVDKLRLKQETRNGEYNDTEDSRFNR